MSRALYEINLPAPIVLESDTPEKIDAIINLIRNAKTENQVQVTASPALAHRLLQLQAQHQRRVNQRTVDQLTNDHRSGQFVYTGDTIKFSNGGMGIDGQHRCEAQVAAGATVKILMVIGVNPAAIEKMDLNRRRNASDVHNTRGDSRIVPTAIMTAAIGVESQNFDLEATRLMSTTARVGADDSLTDQELDFVAAMSQALQTGTVRTVGALAGALRAYRYFQDPITREFLEAAFANQPANPAYVAELSGELFNYLNKTKKAKGGKQSAVHNQAVAVIKTVRALVSGTSVSLKTATPSEITSLCGK